MSELLPEFLRLHTARAMAADLLPHPDVFSKREARRFLAELLPAWAGECFAVALLLRHEGHTIACRRAFHMRETLYL